MQTNREHFAQQLSGHGLEIGPLHTPLALPPNATVDYVDRCTVEELRKQYPELDHLPLVAPTIIDDAETLRTVANEAFDFVVAAHVIEHMRNPFGALANWFRVLRPGGLLYLIVPDKRKTFDKERDRTPLNHIINDYQVPSVFFDYLHFIDYAKHVNCKQGENVLVEAGRLHASNYSIHFHAFEPEDVTAMLMWFAENVEPCLVLEGPVTSEEDFEIHFLLKK